MDEWDKREQNPFGPIIDKVLHVMDEQNTMLEIKLKCTPAQAEAISKIMGDKKYAKS